MTSRLGDARRVAAFIAVAAVLALGLGGPSVLGTVIATVAVAAVTLAGIAAAIETRGSPREFAMARHAPRGLVWWRSHWSWAFGAVALCAAAAMQTWFGGGSAIAAGDVTLPDGTAWLGRLFAPWTWTGNDLGSPGANQASLPWAAILGPVHALGGSPALAQRIFYTAVFVGAGVAAVWMLRMCGLRPIGAAVGALVYVFNAYVLTYVNVNPVFLTALLCLPLLLAIVLAAARGSLRTRQAVMLLGLTMPLVGYADLNPPLAGMLAVALLLSPLLARWLGGRDAGRRALRTLAIGIPVMLVIGAYWIVPVALHLGGAAVGRLSSYQDWAWTQGRATLPNALQLNTFWAWPYTQFFPFSGGWDQLPMALIRYLPGATAFAALLAGRRRGVQPGMATHLRLAVGGVAVAVPLLLLSVGENAPTGQLFGWLYSLPGGWLLREPGRFIMVAGLAYGLLAGLTVQWAVSNLPARVRLPRTTRWARLQPVVLIGAVLAIAIAPAYPLATGAVVPDGRFGLSAHNTLPAYWTRLAGESDSLPAGSVLALPVDDFYEMPYTWGYDGTDGFITNLFSRQVLVPNGDNYVPATPQMLSAVAAVSDGVLSRRPAQVHAILDALGVRYILVRGDIDARAPDRHIVDPAALDSALASSSSYRLTLSEGPLHLYALSDAPNDTGVGRPVFTSEVAPDLRGLPLLGANTHLVTGAAQPNAARLIPVRPIAQWQFSNDTASTSLTGPAGWAYSVVRLDTDEVVASPTAGDVTTTVSTTPNGDQNVQLRMALGGDLIVDDGFVNGQWQAVSDCHDVLGPAGLAHMRGTLFAVNAFGVQRALRLSTTVDSACESRTFRPPTAGRLLVSAWVRHVAGLAPRISLWESGPNRFATVPAVQSTPGWSHYAAVIPLDPGTTFAQLFVHSDSDGSGRPTINDYAHVELWPMSGDPNLALLGTPTTPAATAPLVLVDHSSYSDSWDGPPGATHVRVDGVANGWLVAAPVPSGSATYGAASATVIVAILSLVGVLALTGLGVLDMRRRGRRR
jgi:hypothetical protein